MYRLQAHRIVSAIFLVLTTFSPLAAQENAPLLRYGFAAGKQYAYEVKIQIEGESYDENREGVLNYNVSSAKDNEFTLKQSGSLATHIKAHPGENTGPRMFPPMVPPPGFMMGPPGFPGFGRGEGITFNRRGEKIVSRELTPLPFLLGDVELLVFEEFPAEAKSNWEKQNELHVVERDSSSPFPSFSFAARMDSGTHTTAKEQINYTILKSDKDSVEISKKYSLSSIPEEGKNSHFEMTGDGQFTFDRGQGLIRSLSMKYECRENEKNTTRKYPITLSYRLLSADEMAERQKKAESTKAKNQKNGEPKAFEPGERARLLAELKAKETTRIQIALTRLAKVPADDKPEEVSKALVILLRNSNEWVQKSAAEALVVWATPEAENALIKASQSEDVFLRNPSLQALAKLKTAKAAEAVAAQMYQQISRMEAANALKAMGSVAEDPTIQLLKDRDEWVRAQACEVLGDIGGKKSLKALREFSPQSHSLEDMNRKKAISDIELRLENPSETTPVEDVKAKTSASASPTVAESPQDFRTWHDTSGSFSVDAIMLSVQDGIVVLQKKDGKTIRVPIAKLSPADKKYAADHSGNSAGKADNPFE
jgi:SLA1 homology domain 1, SHD1/HEAT repeats